MGQKTHPIGFRLGINKPWTSNWYGGKKYSDYVAEDIILRKYINQRLSNAGISSISIDRTSKKLTITINTSRPGIVIGKGGKDVDQLREEIKQLSEIETQVNVSEIKRPEMDPKLVGENIAQQLIKKISYLIGTIAMERVVDTLTILALSLITLFYYGSDYLETVSYTHLTLPTKRIV